MKKNVAGQSIGVQMITAADGSAFTGTVTAYVTGDAGTQAIGGTASGVCTHEGNGYHTYVPTQAETNYGFIAFTYIGTGAIPVTSQVYTGFPQSVDNNIILAARLIGTITTGTHYPATAAQIAVLSDWIDGGRLDELLDAIPTTAMRGTDNAASAAEVAKIPKSDGGATWNATALASIKNEADTALSDYDPPTNTEMVAAFATIAGYIDTEITTIINNLAAVDTVANGIQTDLSNGSDGLGALASLITTLNAVADAIKAKTDSLTFTQDGQVDSNVQRINNGTITGDGKTTPFDIA